MAKTKDETTVQKNTPFNVSVTTQKTSFRTLTLITALNFAILMIILILLWINFESIEKIQHRDEYTTQSPDSNKSTTSPNTVSKLRFVTRDEWIAQPPDNKLTELELPVNRVIITHTASEGCDTQATCAYRVRMIQTYHMESKRWDDIGGNFLVGGDGAVYEGRGWDKQGAHTKGYNAGSIGIALIGTFTKHAPPQRQFDALKLLLEEGVRLGKLTTDYTLYPHRAFYDTESPGARVIEVIKTWPHYVRSLV